MTGGELAIVIAGRRDDWPGGARTLTPREPTREPNGTLWFGAELDPDGDQVWFRIAEEAINRMPEKTPAARGRRLVDALIVWITPDRPLEPVAAALMGAAGEVAGQTEELVRTIPMEPGGRLTLRNVEGGITVTGVAGDDLTIRATKRAGRRRGDNDALDRVEIEIEERGNRVIVETEYPGHRRSLLGGGRRDRREPFVAVDYRVAIPRGAGVTIESFAGDVTVEAVDGETRVETVSGDVRLTALARLVTVESFSGDLELTDVRAGDALTARTVSGDIDIEKVRAPRLEVKSFSGAVALRGWSLGESKVETISGSVTLDGVLAADGRYGIRSFSGSILLTVPDDSGFELEAESFSGSLRSDIPVLARPGTTVLGVGSRTIRGTAGEGGAGLELFTVSGDIAISTGEGGTATFEVVPRSLLGLPTPPEPPMPPTSPLPGAP